MEIWSGIIFPLLLGLLGFIEPCSLGANLIFLQYLLSQSPQGRLFHSLLFTLTRAIFLSLLGLASVLIGQRILGVQGKYVVFLGILYLAFGLIVLMRQSFWSFTFPFTSLAKKSIPVLLGAAFGLTIPACASPLILALVGGAALSGQLWFGFSSLFVFGLGLSLPLVVAVYSEKTREGMVRLSHRYPRGLQYTVGGILVIAGLYTLSTQNGSLHMILQQR